MPVIECLSCLDSVVSVEQAIASAFQLKAYKNVYINKVDKEVHGIKKHFITNRIKPSYWALFKEACLRIISVLVSIMYVVVGSVHVHTSVQCLVCCRPCPWTWPRFCSGTSTTVARTCTASATAWSAFCNLKHLI